MDIALRCPLKIGPPIGPRSPPEARAFVLMTGEPWLLAPVAARASLLDAVAINWERR